MGNSGFWDPMHRFSEPRIPTKGVTLHCRTHGYIGEATDEHKAAEVGREHNERLHPRRHYQTTLPAVQAPSFKEQREALYKDLNIIREKLLEVDRKEAALRVQYGTNFDPSKKMGGS